MKKKTHSTKNHTEMLKVHLFKEEKIQHIKKTRRPKLTFAVAENLLVKLQVSVFAQTTPFQTSIFLVSVKESNIQS